MWKRLKVWFFTKILYRRSFAATKKAMQAMCGNPVCPNCIEILDVMVELPNTREIRVEPGYTEAEFDCPHCGVRLHELNLEISLAEDRRCLPFHSPSGPI
jgi:hypothetical protein